MDQIADTAPPASGGHHIVEELLQVAKLTRTHVNIALRVADLHPGQDEVICALTTEPTMTLCQIADLLNVRSSTLSRTTDRLAAKGILERVSVKSDHRKIALILTPAGVETQALVREIWRGVEENLFGELSAAETEEIREGLAILDERLQAKLARLR